MNGLKKSAKNNGSQWYAQFAHCVHTGYIEGKCGFSGRSYSGPTIQIWPYMTGFCTERVMNGLKKSAKSKESQWYAQSAHCAHTGHDKEKCMFCGRFQGRPCILI